MRINDPNDPTGPSAGAGTGAGAGMRTDPLILGLENANDALKGRVVEVSLADLNNDPEQGFRKIQLKVEDIAVSRVFQFGGWLGTEWAKREAVRRYEGGHLYRSVSSSCRGYRRTPLTPPQGKNCLTSFYGMDFTTDKLRSIVRKWQTLIEASVDVRTTDGYILRLFSIGFTKRAFNQVKKTTYAQSSQVREIRSKMVEIMRREAEGSDLKELVQKFVPESIGREIEKACKVSCEPRIQMFGIAVLNPVANSLPRASTPCTTSTSARPRSSRPPSLTCPSCSRPTARPPTPTPAPRS